MSALSDVSAALGVPGWAVPVSVGIYTLSGMIENRMRPEAKAQIGAFLDHGTLKADVPPLARIVASSFTATFGLRQFSWRCFSRTILLSVFTIYAICLIIWAKHGAEIRLRIPDLPSLPTMLLMSLPSVLIYSAVQNWVSVGKTRLILRRVRVSRGLSDLVLWMALDFVLSYVIAVTLYWTVHLAVLGRSDLCATADYYHLGIACSTLDNPLAVLNTIRAISGAMLARALSDAAAFTPDNILAFAMGAATLLTSIWTVLVVAALLILRALLPVNALLRGARWAFDLQATPVRAVGVVAAIIVWLGAVGYAVA